MPTISYPPLMVAISSSCINHKTTFISETVQDRANLANFFTHKLYSHLPLFAKNHFPTIFNSHLEFLYKTQNSIYHINGAFQGNVDKIFGSPGIRSHLALFAKNRFPTIFGSHLECLRKTQKNTFILETVQNIAVLAYKVENPS